MNRRRKAFAPLVAERLPVASHLAELRKTLGTKRRPRATLSLPEYIAQLEKKREAPPAGDQPAA